MNPLHEGDQKCTKLAAWIIILTHSCEWGGTGSQLTTAYVNFFSICNLSFSIRHLFVGSVW